MRGVPLDTELNDDRVDLRGIWASLRSRAPLILGAAILVALGVYAISSLRTELYQSTSLVRIVDPNSQAVFDGVQIRVDPRRDVDTQLRLLRSTDLREAVEMRLGAAAVEISSVTVAVEGGTDLIAITVASPDPAVAQRAADTFASLYVDQRQAQVAAGFTAKADELRAKASELDEQIVGLDAQLADTDPASPQGELVRTRRTSLVNQQADLLTRATEFDVEAATRTGNVEIAETAALPVEPFSPTPVRDAVLAGVLSLLVGTALVLVLHRLDDKVKANDDIERLTGGVPILGSIPVHSSSKRRSKRISRRAVRALVPLKSPAAEAYRTLRTSLRFSSIDTARRTLAITSSDQAEGKSTVAANLAVVMAESGLRVVLVSADLRRPALSSIFGIPDTERGLTSVLVGDATIEECLRSVSSASGQSLYVLPSGPLPQNPAELLGSDGMRSIITTIETMGVDFVLIDTPPVLPVSDAMAVAQFCDGVLVLARVNDTRRGHLVESIELLRQVNADVVGVVLNGVPTRGRYARYGGGGYDTRV